MHGLSCPSLSAEQDLAASDYIGSVSKTTDVWKERLRSRSNGKGNRGWFLLANLLLLIIQQALVATFAEAAVVALQPNEIQTRLRKLAVLRDAFLLEDLTLRDLLRQVKAASQLSPQLQHGIGRAGVLLASCPSNGT